MRTTPEETEKNNRKILDAAIKVFAQKGFAAADMQDIADEAGISRGPLYYRYKNKKRLFVAALLEEMDRQDAEYCGIWSQEKYITDLLYDDLKTCARNIRFGIYLQDLSLAVPDMDDPAYETVRESGRRIYNYIDKAVKRALEKGELKEGADLGKMIDLIFVFSDGLYQVVPKNSISIIPMNRGEETIEDFVGMIELKYCRPGSRAVTCPE